jgi:hypothetical protein
LNLKKFVKVLSLLSHLSQPSVLAESNDFRVVDNLDLSTGLSTGLVFLGFRQAAAVCAPAGGFVAVFGSAWAVC